MPRWQTRMRLKYYLDQGVSKAKLSRRFGIGRRTIPTESPPGSWTAISPPRTPDKHRAASGSTSSTRTGR